MRDVIVKLGTNEGLQSPIRLIEVECTPHKKNSKTGHGGPEQGDSVATVDFMDEIIDNWVMGVKMKIA